LAQPHNTRIYEQLQDLIEKHRDTIIKNTVSDQEIQQQLFAINKAIQVIRGKDPNLVAAWGLGCGGVCLPVAGGPGER
jgi:hypothetical protein